MGRGPSKKGIEARQRILAELARRYVEFEPPPSWTGMMATVGMSSGGMEHHLRILREAGLVHLDALWITRAGLAEAERLTGLTF